MLRRTKQQSPMETSIWLASDPCWSPRSSHPSLPRISSLVDFERQNRKSKSASNYLFFRFPWRLNHVKGLQTLARLHAQGNVDDPWVMAEYEQIQEQITYEAENQAHSYRELFTGRSNFRRMILATACQAACQMTGVSAIQYYSVEIFVSAHVQSPEPVIWMIKALELTSIETNWYRG